MRTDVLVVGGGLAGLTTAVGLLDSGLKITVLESDRILGGRASSWIDSKTGDAVHIGPHILLSEYPNMLAFLARLGTADGIRWEDDSFLTRVDGRKRVVWKLASLPPPMPFIPSMLQDPKISTLDMLSGVRVTLFAMTMDADDVLRLDDMNATAFLRAMGVTRRSMDHLWSFIAMSILNVPLDVCSAGALLRFYRRLTGHTRYLVGFPKVGLGDLFGPQSKRRIEDAGSSVLTNARVETLLLENGRCAGARLDDGREIRARWTIAALPPQALRRIVPRELLTKHACFRELVHFVPCPYVSPYLWFDRKLTSLRFWARWGQNDLNCDFYDFSNIYEGRKHKGSLIASNVIYAHRAATMSDEEIIRETVRELAEFLPGAKKAKVTHSLVNRIPMAIHCPFPGTERRRPDARTPVKSLFLAGDWTKTGLPSSMEGACQSGWRAAELVREAIGKPVSLVKPHKEVEGFTWLFGRLAQLLPQRQLRRLARLRTELLGAPGSLQ